MSDPDADISKAIVASIGRLREMPEFQDFKVVVGGTTIKCNGFLLASCSDFFRGLFRSNMKECIEKSVTLEDVSLETLELILQILYTGSDVLTHDNVRDIWYACHRLQVKFLVTHCEKYIAANLSLTNFESVYKDAKFLRSANVVKTIYHFMMTNFEVIRKTETFLQLSHSELYDIVKSSNLVTSSEDLVLYSIYDWVNYEIRSPDHGSIETNVKKTSTSEIVEQKRQDTILDEIIKTSLDTISKIELETEASTNAQSQSNHRKLYLSDLLKATRYCLASKYCLLDLYNNELTQADPVAKDIFFKATSYQLFVRGHGFWPMAAIHRFCDNLEHIGVFCEDKGLSVICLKSNGLSNIVNGNNATFHSSLAVYQSELFGFAPPPKRGKSHSRINVLQNGWWTLSLSLTKENLQDDVFLLAHEKYIYLFSKTCGEVHWFNPKETIMKLQTLDAEIRKPKFVISYQRNIIIFCTVVKEEIEISKVYCWDTVNDTWKNLGNFNGSVDHMTSFQDETNTYILESGGNLWKIEKHLGVITFTFLKKLWNFQDKLRGAFLFKKTLFIFGNLPTDNMEEEQKYEPVFSTVERWGKDDRTSNFVYFVHPKNYLKKD